MEADERRLHRAAIAVYVLAAVRDAALPIIAVAFAGALRGGLDVGDLVTGLVYAAIGVVVAAVTGWYRWDTTRWWVTADGIHRRRGLFSTKQTDVPLSRIQALDLEQGPVQRLFGVYAVHVQTAGGGAKGEIVLEAIGEDELRQLQARVGAPVERVDVGGWRLGRGRLLLAALTAGQIGVILPLLAAAGQLLQNVIGDEASAERDAVGLIPHSVGGWVLAAVVLLLAAWLLSGLGAVVAFAGFSVSRDGDRVRIRRGLLAHREATIPVARVRAVVVVEGVLRRPFGLASLRLEVIGHAAEPGVAQALFPLLRRGEVRGFLDDLLPELADDVDGLAGLPRRALRRYVLPPALAALVVGALAWPLAGFWGLFAALLAAAYGAARFRAAGWRFSGDRLAVRSLRLARLTVLAPAARRESHTFAQNVLQRRGDLADLEVAFGKRTTARIHHLDAATARELFTRLAPPPRPTRGDG